MLLDSPSSPGYGLLATGYSALRALDALLVPEAKAWTGPIASASRIHFYHTDHLGSTRIVTDADGDVFERIDYLPFGEIFRDDVASGPDTDYERHRFKFTGQMYDYLTNLYYYGARYYDPEMGRFTQADTIVPRPLDGQTFNRYAYCYNNPYKYVDPSGHNPLWEFIQAVAETVAVAVAFYVNPVLGCVMAGLFSAYHAVQAGATGGAVIGAFMQGFVTAGFSYGLSPGNGITNSRIPGFIMMGAGVAQAVASNDPDAIASCVGSLLGGYLSPQDDLYGIPKDGNNPGKIPSNYDKYDRPGGKGVYEFAFAGTASENEDNLAMMRDFVKKHPGTQYYDKPVNETNIDDVLSKIINDKSINWVNVHGHGSSNRVYYRNSADNIDYWGAWGQGTWQPIGNSKNTMKGLDRNIVFNFLTCRTASQGGNIYGPRFPAGASGDLGGATIRTNTKVIYETSNWEYYVDPKGWSLYP